jgi:alpha 1,2-mannosyltransferase
MGALPVMRQRGLAFKLIIISAFCFFAYLCISSTTASNYLLGATDFSHSGIGRFTKSYSNPLQSPKLVSFWAKYVDVLLEAKPQVDKIKPEGSATEDDIHVSPEEARTHKRLNLTHLSDSELTEMKRSHSSMVESIRKLVPDFPYEAGTRGVVTTAGGAYFGVAIASIRMLRRVGSTLPVQVFLDNWDDYDIDMCERMLPELGARCFVLSEIWDSTPQVGKLLKYQFKVFSLLFSSFEHVLFLDADAFPAHNPDALLDSEPYKSMGLITWPDFWVSTTSPVYYDIAGIPVPPLDARRCSESGIMLLNKKQHAAALMLATYYNYYGPDYYYPLFSQGAPGEGDKETFIHAAMALNEPFYDVKTPVSVMGAHLNGEWHSAGMKQASPVEDYGLQNMKANMKRPKDEEMQEFIARPFFIHNNIVKLDFKHLFDSENWWNKPGNLSKLWGDVGGVYKDFGYDVELGLWEELVTATCELGADQCKKSKEYVKEVFEKDL